MLLCVTCSQLHSWLSSVCSLQCLLFYSDPLCVSEKYLHQHLADVFSKYKEEKQLPLSDQQHSAFPRPFSSIILYNKLSQPHMGSHDIEMGSLRENAPNQTKNYSNNRISHLEMKTCFQRFLDCTEEKPYCVPTRCY